MIVKLRALQKVNASCVVFKSEYISRLRNFENIILLKAPRLLWSLNSQQQKLCHVYPHFHAKLFLNIFAIKLIEAITNRH